MSLDEITDEKGAIILRTIDRLAKSKVWYSGTDRQREATDYTAKAFLITTLPSAEDVEKIYKIYEAKVNIYKQQRAEQEARRKR